MTGVKERTVHRILEKAGLGRNLSLLTLEELEKAWLLLEDGASYNEVARTIGRPYSAVRKALPGYTWTKEQMVARAALARKFNREMRNA